MIKLHGFVISNYYNMVKCVLLEQGIEFEEVNIRPSQDEDYLARSPMGKVPCIETDQGFLSETSVIIEYLDEIGAGPSLFPQDPYEKAKVRELMHLMELYIELPARRLYGDVFFGRPASDELKQEVKEKLEKGFAALSRVAKYDPYIAGSEFTYADIFFRFSVGLATVVCRKALDWDAFNDLTNVRPLLELIDQRESVQQAIADQAKAA